ncbi:Glu-tRNA(Gln) amidotransferase GatDE subunit D, partial [Candidatus Woesearchaeota archaeon]
KETVKALKKSTGVVITQGTDTMHYTAAALSFLIKDLNKPVIITGAQRSIDRGSSDAFMNLICSVNAAAHYDGAITGICMHGTINDDYCLLIRGTNARKMHTTRRDTFRPINAKALAKIYPEKIEKLREDYPKRNEKTPQALKLDNKVALIHIYPGIKPQLIEYQAKKSHGIIIAATALGHVPTHNTKSLMPVLKKWAKKIPIIITSQTLYGRVHPYVYTPLRKLSIETGCIFAANTLPETAYAKLMVMLANTKTTEEAKQKMQENIAGEINERETAKEFLE